MLITNHSHITDILHFVWHTEMSWGGTLTLIGINLIFIKMNNIYLVEENQAFVGQKYTKEDEDSFQSYVIVFINFQTFNN